MKILSILTSTRKHEIQVAKTIEKCIEYFSPTKHVHYKIDKKQRTDNKIT